MRIPLRILLAVMGLGLFMGCSTSQELSTCREELESSRSERDLLERHYQAEIASLTDSLMQLTKMMEMLQQQNLPTQTP